MCVFYFCWGPQVNNDKVQVCFHLETKTITKQSFAVVSWNCGFVSVHMDISSFNFENGNHVIETTRTYALKPLLFNWKLYQPEKSMQILLQHFKFTIYRSGFAHRFSIPDYYKIATISNYLINGIRYASLQVI